jgi:hypothetical protein
VVLANLCGYLGRFGTIDEPAYAAYDIGLKIERFLLIDRVTKPVHEFVGFAHEAAQCGPQPQASPALGEPVPPATFLHP